MIFKIILKDWGIKKNYYLKFKFFKNNFKNRR